jgi:hypothetical protein
MDLIDITEWASSEIKTITLSQICVDAPYDVQVREFVPMEGDMLESTWLSGPFVKRHRMPMYALVSMESAASTLKWLTQKYVGKYIVQTIGNLDLLIWTTYFFAFQYQTKAKVGFLSPLAICNLYSLLEADYPRKSPDRGLPEVLGRLS